MSEHPPKAEPLDLEAVEQAARRYLEDLLGGRKGFDLWLFVGEDKELEREVIGELADFLAARDRAIAEQARQDGARLERERCARRVEYKAYGIGVSNQEREAYMRAASTLRALPPLPPAEESRDDKPTPK